MTAFREAIGWRRTEDRWEGDVDPEWGQGRATFGGLQAAIALRALQELAPDRPPRTLHIAYCGPLGPGPATFHGRVERSGGSVTVATGRFEQGGTAATVTASFGRGREGRVVVAGSSAPELRPPTPIRMPQGEGIPRFTRFVWFDLQEGMPYTGSPPTAGGYVRFVEPEPADACYLAALADAWPPAAVAALEAPRPSSSVDLTYDFVRPPPLEDVAPDAWFTFRAETEAAADGYAIERGWLWDEHGRLAVRIRQLRAIY